MKSLGTEANQYFNQKPTNRLQQTTQMKSNQSFSSPKMNPYSSATNHNSFTHQNNYNNYNQQNHPSHHHNHHSKDGKDNENINRRLLFDDVGNIISQETKQLLKESQRRISSISMVDAFKQNIENRDSRESSYTRVFNSVTHTQQLQLLHNQHRTQVQKLLMEISRLHDVIYELQRTKKYEIHKLKQEFQQVTYLHLNNVKQSQNAQMEILEAQVKKTRAAFQQKCYEYDELLRTTNKQKEMLFGQIEILRINVKDVVDKKNEQIFEMQEKSEQKLKYINNITNQALQEMKQSCEKQIRKIQKQLKQKQERLERIRITYEETSEKNDFIQQKIENERVQLEQRLQKYIIQGNNRYNALMENMEKIFEEQSRTKDDKQNLMKQTYENQIRNLLNIIKIKNQQNNRIKTQQQTQKLEYKLLTQNTEHQNQYLRKLIRMLEVRNLQQIQQLKIKMALLHENDLKQLVKLYQTKIQCLNAELHTSDEQSERVKKYMHEQTKRWYQNKKEYEQKISKLTVEVSRLKNGIGNIQKDMKERIQNQRSAMLLTSKSLIRGVELKNTNVKFYQDQLRKLRSIIERIEKQSEQQQNQLKKQLRGLQQEMKRVIQTNKKKQQEHSNTEQEYNRLIADKDNEIKRLNKLAHQIIETNQYDESEELSTLKKRYEQMNEQLKDKNDKVKELLTKMQKMQRDLQDCKIQNQQLYLQNQINHEQAKGQYEKIAQASAKSLKQFYERKLHELQQDKRELKSKLSANQADTAEIVRKYNLLEDYIKKMIRQSQKRTLLQEKIINLGMDNNLIKNKAQLFAHSASVSEQ